VASASVEHEADLGLQFGSHSAAHRGWMANLIRHNGHQMERDVVPPFDRLAIHLSM
jgi:hypothetical protein